MTLDGVFIGSCYLMSAIMMMLHYRFCHKEQMMRLESLDRKLGEPES